MTNPLHVSVEEVQMLLGQRDVEIYALQKQIVALQKRVEELTPKTEEPKA